MATTEIQGVVFPALTDAQRQTLLSRCTPRAYAKGETIFSRGEPGSLIFVIETGRVEVSVTSRRGCRTILNQMGPGEVLGELAMLDGDPRSADARAATDATGRILTRQHFLVFLSDFPEMAAAIIQEICRKLRNLSDLHADQLATDGARRLALVLSRLFSKWARQAKTARSIWTIHSHSPIWVILPDWRAKTSTGVCASGPRTGCCAPTVQGLF